MNLAPPEFRAALASLSPDERVRLSHANRGTLERALGSIKSSAVHRSALEIGCWKGETTLWLLDHGIEHVTVVDTFQGSTELGSHDFLEDFLAATVARRAQITFFKGRSIKVLGRLHCRPVSAYDFIYVDGSHDSRDVIADAALAFELLVKGGVMVFDDYLWNFHDDPCRNPGPAIDFFVKAWSDQIRVLETGYQLVVRKDKAT